MTSKFSNQNRWRLFTFALATTLFLTCLMLALDVRHGKLPRTGRITQPKHQHETPPPFSHANEGWSKVRAFEHLMDSLKDDSSGRKIYDSILKARPRILDSARVAEEFYYTHEHK